MKISLVSSAHKFNDDRLFYHFAKTLNERGHTIEIITDDQEINTNIDSISISSFNGNQYSRKEKISIYTEKLNLFKPDIVICLEPIPIIAAKNYSKKNKTKIVYDITEWYPSKRNLRNHAIILRPLYFILYFSLYLYACYITDSFIFGEYYKGLLPKFLFQNKPNTIISYYPKKEYLPKSVPQLKKNKINLCYSGNLGNDGGIKDFFNVIDELILSKENLNINIKFIGNINPKDEELLQEKIKNYSDNIKFHFYDFQEFLDFIELIKDVDVFLDLRKLDLENNHSLPIKLFYFMALGKPVIYSNLKAIKREIEIDTFGHLVNPKNSNHIANLILNYQINPNLYLSHCSKARDLFEQKYNWDLLNNKFNLYIESLTKK
ncbi:glycosyltransferase [Urechidicola croceus]|uniref:Glycosyl transferase family 1 domain-containing protein n=1 Tax=Urechidicola croceus TaxID=1850246 RepID=A0A1D8PB43_9FLAO|nr:glycosyltransferase [Urechidicola croceus]AOW21778.1 hypothetical protein LPB138_14305 [Urechidicola croceus]